MDEGKLCLSRNGVASTSPCMHACVSYRKNDGKKRKGIKCGKQEGAGVPGFSNVRRYFPVFGLLSSNSSLFSPPSRFKRVPAIQTLSLSLSLSLSLFSPPRHYFPSLRFFSLSALLFFSPLSSRLVAFPAWRSALFQKSSADFAGTFQWRNVTSDAQSREKGDRGREKRKRERGREFLRISPRSSYFFPHCVLISLERLMPRRLPLFLSTLCREQVFHRLRARPAISL